jgi:hypothetical protein
MASIIPLSLLFLSDREGAQCPICRFPLCGPKCIGEDKVLRSLIKKCIYFIATKNSFVSFVSGGERHAEECFLLQRQMVLIFNF